jgi:hypothetical protein
MLNISMLLNVKMQLATLRRHETVVFARTDNGLMTHRIKSSKAE